jgi:hypothetical protein
MWSSVRNGRQVNVLFVQQFSWLYQVNFERLTPSYAAKDTIFWQKRPKTIVIRIIVLDDNIQIYSYGLLFEPVLSMQIYANSARVWTRSTSLSSFQWSNWSPTYILHLFHLEDTSHLFIFLFFHTQNYCRFPYWPS